MLGQEGDEGEFSIADIKLLDPHAIAIIDNSEDVASLCYNQATHTWTKSSTKSSLFIYNRDIEPRHVLYLRRNGFGEVTLLTAEKTFKIDSPYLLYNDELDCIYGFEFKTRDECQRIGKLVQYTHLRAQQLNKAEDYADILSLLNSVQGVYVESKEIKEATKSLAGATPSTSGTARAARKPGRNKKKGKNRSDAPSTSGTANAARKHARNEKKGTVPSNASNISAYSVPFQRKILSSASTAVAEPQKNLNLCPTKNVSSAACQANQSEISDKPKSSMENPSPRVVLIDENHPPNKYPLASGVFRLNKLDEIDKSEPLTQNQLLQAVSYLIKTENGFMDKLHEAYWESFIETIPIP